MLRPYQSDILTRAAASSARRKVIQSPTGSGKSVLIREACNAPRLAVLAHAEHLVDQLSERMPGSHQIVAAGARYDGSKHIVGMIQSVANRLDSIPPPDRVLVDEGHHAISPTYQRILNAWPDAEVLLYTATPQRLDGQGLEAVADDLICGPQYRELIAGGYLKPFEVYSVPSDLDLSQCRVLAGDYRKGDVNDAIRKSSIFGDVAEHWRRLGRDGGHASFWPSIEAAEHAAVSVPGWHALHSKMPKEQIRSLIAGLRSGSVESLATVGMIGEGLDVPGLASVSLCRPTQSLTVYMQQSGRCNRGGSGVARVLDHVGNWQRHGLPDDDRTWSLKGRVKTKREASGAVPVWQCGECWGVNRSSEPCCTVCGTAKPRELVIIEEREARLELITAADIKDVHELCATAAEYREFAKAHGKQPTWAAYKWAERQNRTAEDNPFLAAAGTVRPSMEQFMRAAHAMGLHPQQAKIAARHMHLYWHIQHK